MKLFNHVAGLWMLGALSAVSAEAETFLVQDGRGNAEIVIAEQPPRTTRLAAQELQLYIEKISGAKLDIVTEPSSDVPVRVFIGRSSHTDKLKISSDGLKDGAYRVVSGDDWLVLMGDDTDFVPIEPWPRSNGDWVSGRVHQQWHKITDSQWGNPLSQLRKHYTGSAGSFGKPDHQPRADDGSVHVWGFDERGSFNAVCGFLRSLGVRWYLPGELGEVVPKLASIALPRIDQTVRADFPVRSVNIRFGVHGAETARWAMRLGIRNPYGLQTAHGLHTMTHNEQILSAHPDWFALYGGKRHNQFGGRLNQLCYSNQELLRETVRYVRAQLDHYQFDVVSVMPPDGYTAICQCEKCAGKDTPERGYRGAFSDYVWDFVNQVAKEVRKTHPQRMISNCAYGTYTLPPNNIDKLEPNIQVIIVGGRRPTSEARDEIRQLRSDWLAKTDNPIMVFENYPFTDRGFYLPAYIPGVLGESINATKGISRGEDIWLSIRQDFHQKAIGFNHFLVYFTARMYWGGKQQDVMAMFDEYCRLFYGPAASEMRVFFDYCENNWREMEKDEIKASRALELFAAAQLKGGGDSVYAKRLALIDEYLDGLRNKRAQLAQKRGPVPRLRLVGETRSEIVIDGKLDDEAWENCPVAATGRLRELQTGRQPIFGTSFKTAWRGGNLYFAIRCEERRGEPLNIATTKNGDQAIWYGDAVEILLDTESHSYYQIAINPSAALVDLDRGTDKNNWFGWNSKAEVATDVADDHWTVEIRIPVVQDENDPLHLVIGRKPTASLPWHVNICRQRIRENGSEHSAFAPTGKLGFHVPMKFAHFYDGRSQTLDADPSVTDFLIAQRQADELLRQRKHSEALAAFVALADGDDVNDYQKSAALEQAAVCARNLRDYQRADKLADQIPLTAVAATVRMHNLLAQRDPQTLLEQFAGADLSTWPFWKTGEGHFLRGRAFADTGAGKQAEADFLYALEFTTQSLDRMNVQLAQARNREQNLDDKQAALATYMQIVQANRNTGNATYYYAILDAARLQREAGNSDDALATIGHVNVERLTGTWHANFHRALGDTHAAAGQKQQALAAYQEVLTNQQTHKTVREAVEKAIQNLTP